MHRLSEPFLPKLTPSILHTSHKKLLTNINKNISYSSSISEKPELSIAGKQNQKHGVKQSLLTTIFKSLDDFVSNFMDLPLTPSIDPDHVLSGNFAPVAELPPTACEVVEGSLPACLDGAYIRNGPNPHFIPRGPYHLFDGDGMLHAIRISGAGEASFCSRYVKTYKFITESNEGYPFFPSPFSSFNGILASAARVFLVVARAVSGSFDPMLNGFGTANTSLAFFGGSLYALCESDLPYEIELTSDGEIVTLGRRNFCGGDSLRMTAHPKIDSGTGEVFAFRCNMFSPFLTFFRIDSCGRKGLDLPVLSLKKTPCVHDFALTERFIIFQDSQIAMEPLEIARGKGPLVCDRGKVPRVGIMQRDAVDDAQILWIETPGVNMLHVTNAWEEDSGDKIVILAPNFLSVENGFHNANLIDSSFEMITLHVKEKKLVSRHVLCSKNMEFGVINPAYAQKKNKYLYAAVLAEIPKAVGVVKLDLSLAKPGGGDCTVGSREYGAGCYGGEPCFVARETGNPAAEEDDGYVVTYVHDENSKESYFLVMNAKSPNLEIVARVRLPGRVPYGFHGLFVPHVYLKSL